MGLDITIVKDGKLIHHDRLGNASFINRIHRAICAYPDLFPIILEKITYLGSHFGDEISPEIVRPLMDEVDRLSTYPIDANDQDKESIFEFTDTLRSACRIAIHHDAGIRF